MALRGRRSRRRVGPALTGSDPQMAGRLEGAPLRAHGWSAMAAFCTVEAVFTVPCKLFQPPAIRNAPSFNHTHDIAATSS